VTTTCSCFVGCFAPSSININELIAITDRNAARGAIDDTANLARHRLWLFSGTRDTIAPQRLVADLFAYYRHYLAAANMAYKNDVAAEHAMPTDFFGNPCGILDDPYIVNCSYDAAGQLLLWIHGNLNPRNAAPLGGAFVNFDQGEFIDHSIEHGMAPDGWLFVPAGCANRQSCKLHVAFHGCKQYETYRYFSPASGLVTCGTTFVRNTGYNKWAGTNNIIVLYPQAIASAPIGFAPNPYGCWDWWGFDDENYAIKSDRQMAARQSHGRQNSRQFPPAGMQPAAVTNTALGPVAHDAIARPNNAASVAFNASNRGFKALCPGSFFSTSAVRRRRSIRGNYRETT